MVSTHSVSVLGLPYKKLRSHIIWALNHQDRFTNAICSSCSLLQPLIWVLEPKKFVEMDDCETIWFGPGTTYSLSQYKRLVKPYNAYHLSPWSSSKIGPNRARLVRPVAMRCPKWEKNDQITQKMLFHLFFIMVLGLQFLVRENERAQAPGVCSSVYCLVVVEIWVRIMITHWSIHYDQ